MIRPCLPAPRGLLSEFVIDRLRSPDVPLAVPAVWHSDDPLTDDDFALALYVAYDCTTEGFPASTTDWSGTRACSPSAPRWSAPSSIACSRSAARRPAPATSRPICPTCSRAPEVPHCRRTWSSTGRSPRCASFAVHRSAYQLKEADPHTWAIPRLEGSTKAALIRIQADEYGYGTTHRMHQQLFVDTMRALGWTRHTAPTSTPCPAPRWPR